MSIDTNTTEQLRQAALDHLWQHNRDWESAARDQEPLIFCCMECHKDIFASTRLNATSIVSNNDF